MNAKVRTLIFIASAAGMLSGLIMFLWWYNSIGTLHTVYLRTEELKAQGHTWGANSANITWSVANTGGADLSVSEVQVNRSITTTVTYGGSFAGTTTHTLVREAAGTITITYPFRSGVNYKFEVVTTRGNIFGFDATAP